MLGQAVGALTARRDESLLAREDEARGTMDYCLAFLRRHGITPSWLGDATPTLLEWLAYARSVTGTRTPADLRVLYLCGPEPLNDLDHLESLGVARPNVWAVESETEEYRKAVADIARSGRFLRLHQGKLVEFFDRFNERFDLIYYDGCLPFLSGKPNSILPVVELFARERLNPLAALVTNFSTWPEDQEGSYDLAMSQFYAPRHDDLPRELWETGADPAEARTDGRVLLPYVRQTRASCYGDFITRFLAELGGHIVPHTRVGASRDLLRHYFAPDTERRRVEEHARRTSAISHVETLGDVRRWMEETGDVELNSPSYPLLSFLVRCERDAGTKRLVEPLLNYNGFGTALREAFPKVALLESVLEGHWKLASGPMLEALKLHWFDEGRAYFCDVPLPNLIVNMLLGIYSHPYHLNPRASARVEYVAKTRRMYADCLVLDQARYFYDYLPTIDLIPARWSSPAFQLAARVFLDRFGWHDWESTAHPFSGSALAGIGETPWATRYTIPPRVVIPQEEHC